MKKNRILNQFQFRQYSSRVCVLDRGSDDFNHFSNLFSLVVDPDQVPV